MKRRDFLKIAGIAVVQGVAMPLAGLFSISQGETLKVEKTGPKWAMAVDIKLCARIEGCRDCIDACNRAHNIPDLGNRKEEVKWIWKTSFVSAFEGRRQESAWPLKSPADSLAVLCNHCENPPCVKVCPTKATWKRDDGIVMIDFHRCIGCRYCMAACPYGARSFNWRDPRPFIKGPNLQFPTRTKGVVEKCNFCEERLWKGLLPACVEACREKALLFGDLRALDSPVTKALAERYSIWRKPHLGTKPKVFYLL
jgi:Fe-S-cluster-containing dehydrogenase component